MDKKLLKIYREIFTAFSTLSDAQELISMERNNEAIDMINHAKAHLNKIAAASDEDMEIYKMAMVTIPFMCDLNLDCEHGEFNLSKLTG